MMMAECNNACVRLCVHVFVLLCECVTLWVCVRLRVHDCVCDSDCE